MDRRTVVMKWRTGVSRLSRQFIAAGFGAREGGVLAGDDEDDEVGNVKMGDVFACAGSVPVW